MIDWDFNGTYTDETAYFIRASGSWSYSTPEEAVNGSSGIVPIATIVLSNKDGRFSSLNSASPIYSAISNGGAYQAPMYLQINLDGAGFVTIFKGFVKLPAEISAAAKQFPVISLECRGIEDIYIQRRLKTSQAELVVWYEEGKNESEIIESWLTALGLTSSDWSLDPGLFVIPFVYLDDASVIEACWSLAASCVGRFYSTPDGKLRYENMFHWLLPPHDTSQETLTRASYEAISPRYNDKDIYNKVIVKSKIGTIDVEDDIWTQGKAIVIPPGETKTVTADIGSPIYNISNITYDAITSGGTDMSTSITMSYTYYAEVVELEFENLSSVVAVEIHNIVLTGQKITFKSDIQAERTSTNGFWTDRQGRTRTVSDVDYIQSLEHAEMLAQFLLDRNEVPRILWLVEKAIGKPGRLLGDRVTVNDTSVMTSARDAVIISIDWSIDRNGFTQDLTLFDLDGYFEYMGASPGYFIINTSKLGSSGSGTARIFY